jgi:hypothetical protein
MTERQASEAQAMADRVLEFAEEVEASGQSVVGGDALEAARAALHEWVDGLTAVVVMPAFGRVTVIHRNGRESTISSPDLPFAMSAPVGKKP